MVKFAKSNFTTPVPGNQVFRGGVGLQHHKAVPVVKVADMQPTAAPGLPVKRVDGRIATNAAR